MFSAEVRTLILQVIQSWQVIAITITLILYLYLVNYVSRTYHRPHSVSKAKPKKAQDQPKSKEKKQKKDKTDAKKSADDEVEFTREE